VGALVKKPCSNNAPYVRQQATVSGAIFLPTRCAPNRGKNAPRAPASTRSHHTARRLSMAYAILRLTLVRIVPSNYKCPFRLHGSANFVSGQTWHYTPLLLVHMLRRRSRPRPTGPFSCRATHEAQPSCCAPSFSWHWPAGTVTPHVFNQVSANYPLNRVNTQ
jgi:hypothetical protein